jgi:hypothetical protein
MAIPDIVYRVFDDSSVSKFDSDVGFLAGDPTWTIEDTYHREKMHSALTCHLKWRNRLPTPFISTFSSPGKALNEAKRRVESRYSNVYIAKINAKLLRDAGIPMDQVDQLAHQYGVDDLTWVNNVEYIFLSHIPSSAICILIVDELVKLLIREVRLCRKQLLID